MEDVLRTAVNDLQSKISNLFTCGLDDLQTWEKNGTVDAYFGQNDVCIVNFLYVCILAEKNLNPFLNFFTLKCEKICIKKITLIFLSAAEVRTCGLQN